METEMEMGMGHRNTRQTLSCILCLGTNSRKYHNLCNHCCNFILCDACYKRDQTHQLVSCVMCRERLIKESQVTTYTEFKSILYFLRYIILYILGIFVPSLIFMIGYTEDLSSNYFATNKAFFILTSVVNHTLILPHTINYYIIYQSVLYGYVLINAIFCILYALIKQHNPSEFYTIYVVIYYYIGIYFHFSLIVAYELRISFNTSILNHIKSQNMYRLKIFETYHLFRSTRARVINPL